MKKTAVAVSLFASLTVAVVALAAELAVVHKGYVCGRHTFCETRYYAERAARNDAVERARDLCARHECTFDAVEHGTMECLDSGCEEDTVMCEVDSRVFCKCPVPGE